MFDRIRRLLAHRYFRNIVEPIIVTTLLILRGFNPGIAIVFGIISPPVFHASVGFLNRIANVVSDAINQALGRNAPSLSNSQRTAIVGQIINHLNSGNKKKALKILSRSNVKDPSSLLTIGAQAIRSNDKRILEFILRIPAFSGHIADENNKLLTTAIRENRHAMVKRLLKFKVVKDNAAANHSQPLREACHEGNLDIVRELLKCPVIKKRKNITFNHNEPLRIAQNAGHFDIVARLLRVKAVQDYTIPEGAALTFTNHHHASAPPSASSFANYGRSDWWALDPEIFWRESAMRTLDSGQMNAISQMEERYREIYKERGLDAILDEIKQFLIKEYKKAPAKHDGNKLPLEYKSSLSSAANEAYYRHPVHGAYRYLFLRPNPWIDPNAHFTDQIGEGRAASISAEDRKRIAHMWLAVNDRSRPLPEGFKRENIKGQLVQILADMGRGHNRDNKKDNFKQADRPTCSLGVSQAATQLLSVFLNDNVKTRILNEDRIKQKFGEILITEGRKNSTFAKLSKMSKTELKKLGEALVELFENMSDLGDLDEEQKALLAKIEPTPAMIKACVKECKEYWGDKRITQKMDKPIAYQTHRFNTYEELIRHLGKNYLGEYYTEISGKINQQLKEGDDKAEDKVLKKNAKVLTFSKKEKPTSHDSSSTQSVESHDRKHTRKKSHR